MQCSWRKVFSLLQKCWNVANCGLPVLLTKCNWPPCTFYRTMSKLGSNDLEMRRFLFFGLGVIASTHLETILKQRTVLTLKSPWIPKAAEKLFLFLLLREHIHHHVGSGLHHHRGLAQLYKPPNAHTLLSQVCSNTKVSQWWGKSIFR